jgi:hypothetical protein
MSKKNFKDTFYIYDFEHKLRERILFLFKNNIIICRLKSKTTAEAIATNNSKLNHLFSGTIPLINHFKGNLIFKTLIPLSAIKSIKMDNFDENDDKFLIELNLSKDILNAEKFILKESNETSENLLQNDNSRLFLQSKNPYSKLAFIKSLKDNLICLGFLEETIDTLNYQEDFFSNTITSASNIIPKKRKILTRKRSYDKTNIIIEKAKDLEFNEDISISNSSVIRTSLTKTINYKSDNDENGYDDKSLNNYSSRFKNRKLIDDDYPIVNFTSLAPQPNKDSRIIYKNDKGAKSLFGSSSSISNTNLQFNDGN